MNLWSGSRIGQQLKAYFRSNQLINAIIRVVHIAKNSTTCRASFHTGWFLAFPTPGDAKVAFLYDTHFLRFWFVRKGNRRISKVIIFLNCITSGVIGTGNHTCPAANAFVVINLYRSIRSLIAGLGRAHCHTRGILTMIA